MDTSAKVEIKILRLPHSQGIKLPKYESAQAAGFDLCAAVKEDLIINPSERMLVPTGFIMELPKGYEGQVRPRSGLATKHGITLPNTPGTVDSDYRGEIKVPIINLGNEPFTITREMRIAQMIIAPVVQATFNEIDEINKTDRGSGGFGSTGI